MSNNDSSNKGNTGPVAVAPANGKLGIMIPGMGAVATTFVAGVEAVRKGISSPIGSATPLGHIRIGQEAQGLGDADGTYSTWQADRGPFAQDQGLRASRWIE